MKSIETMSNVYDHVMDNLVNNWLLNKCIHSMELIIVINWSVNGWK